MLLEVSRAGTIGAAVAIAVAGVAMLGIGVSSIAGDGGTSDIGVDAPPPVTARSAETTDGAAIAAPDPPDVDPPSLTGWATFPPSPDLAPTRVRIPSIEVDANVTDLGLNPDRTLEVPTDISVTGWYTGRSVPGELGPGVLVGHVDSAIAGAGVFFDLRHLEIGDTIEVERSDGSVAHFVVTDMVSVDKDDFPTERVYGSTDEPTLRLITCGGSFDRGTRSYVDNVIVYAEHRGNHVPANVKL